MGEIRKRYSSRTIIPYADFSALSGSSKLVCVDNGVLMIVRALLRDRGLWKTTYYQNILPGDLYEVVSDVQFDAIDAAVSEFLTEGNMATCDELTTAIQALAANASSGGCGCGASGAGATSPAADTTNTGDITAGSGTPPDGYTSWAQYQQKKCDIATWIVNNLLDDIQWLQTINLAGLTIVALTAGIAGFLSANVVLLMLSVLAAIVAYDQTVLEDGEQALVEGFDDLVCSLVTGSTASGSISQFETEMSTQIDTATADTLGRILLKQLMYLWADTTSVNLMYEPYDSATAVQVPIGGDCAPCGLACTTDFVEFGELSGIDEYDSVYTGTNHRVRLWFRSSSAQDDGSGSCGSEQQVKITLTGWTDAGQIYDNFRFWDDTDFPLPGDGPAVYSSDTAPSSATDYCMRMMDIISSTAFTVNLSDRVDCSST